MPLTPIDDPTLIAEVAPTGKLRAVINLGNAVLARQQPDSDEPAGVSVDPAPPPPPPPRAGGGGGGGVLPAHQTVPEKCKIPTTTGLHTGLHPVKVYREASQDRNPGKATGNGDDHLIRTITPLPIHPGIFCRTTPMYCGEISIK